MSKSNMYNLVSSIIDGMEIGEKKTVPLPDNMPYFRKYLSEISKRQDQRYTTKIVGDELEIMRIKYHNLYSREVE